MRSLIIVSASEIELEPRIFTDAYGFSRIIRVDPPHLCKSVVPVGGRNDDQYLNEQSEFQPFYSEMAKNVKLNMRFKIADMMYDGKLEY